MHRFIAATCIVATFVCASSCSQQSLATRSTNIEEPGADRAYIKHVEQIVKSRLTTPLPMSIHLPQEIRQELQSNAARGSVVLYDDTYWIFWAERRFGAYTRVGNNRTPEQTSGMIGIIR
jgi:hypothetical protein